LLEWVVRRRVKALDRVRFVEGSVRRLLAPKGRVEGVVLADETALHADLVVDASGRGSQAGSWLAELGVELQADTVVDAGIVYTSRIYEGRPRLPNGWLALTVLWAPPRHKRGAFVLPIEGERTLVTLFGGGGDSPQLDDASFIEFARSLRTSVVHDAIHGARPIGDIHRSRSTVNRIRHFERLPRMPAGFVVMGDAAVAFNPTYGQGMSVAAMEAAVLRDAASNGSFGPLGFQRKLAREVKDVWLAATGEDFRLAETTGPRPASARWIHRYMDGVQHLAVIDPAITALLAGVYLLERPISDLMRPAVAMRVLPLALRGSDEVAASVPPP
jgi:2-polyprenyl-6-methoxyphenol hydroxylase-like FAD-dependent oxidoreductase